MSLSHSGSRRFGLITLAGDKDGKPVEATGASSLNHSGLNHSGRAGPLILEEQASVPSVQLQLHTHTMYACIQPPPRDSAGGECRPSGPPLHLDLPSIWTSPPSGPPLHLDLPFIWTSPLSYLSCTSLTRPTSPHAASASSGAEPLRLARRTPPLEMIRGRSWLIKL